MKQTKLTAHLPMADIEISRRELPEQQGEAITIHITAVPSLDAFTQWLVQMSLFPFAPTFALWNDILRNWQPWLPAASKAEAPLSLVSPEQGRTHRPMP